MRGRLRERKERVRSRSRPKKKKLARSLAGVIEEEQIESALLFSARRAPLSANISMGASRSRQILRPRREGIAFRGSEHGSARHGRTSSATTEKSSFSTPPLPSLLLHLLPLTISTAQHARPKVIGHIDPSRAQLTSASTLDTTNSAAGELLLDA